MDTQRSYAEEHEVMLFLRRITPCVSGNPDMYLQLHLNYYKALGNNRVLRYGLALTGDLICILLRVFSDKDFENILLNDPALDNIYELVSAVPFANVL